MTAGASRWAPGERPRDATAMVGAPPETLDGTTDAEESPFDPLRLCIYTTVALLGWLLGPWAVAWFAVTGFLGYRRARAAGLTRSKCLLRDTRLVLGYLALIALVALLRIGFALTDGTWR